MLWVPFTSFRRPETRLSSFQCGKEFILWLQGLPAAEFPWL